MRKNSKLVPPALKHGIYSAIGLLPTEDPVEFEKFKLEIFDDYKPAGRSEIIIVEEIACLQWRLQHLPTYGVARGNGGARSIPNCLHRDGLYHPFSVSNLSQNPEAPRN
jgi:hypothetical protein